MAMPETSVHENHLTSCAEYYVRPSRQVFAMQPIAIAEPMYKFTDKQLRPGILAADRAHNFAARFSLLCYSFSQFRLVLLRECLLVSNRSLFRTAFCTIIRTVPLMPIPCDPRISLNFAIVFLSRLTSRRGLASMGFRRSSRISVSEAIVSLAVRL